jgi:hypothetical protein
MAPKDKIVPIIAFGRWFLVEHWPRSSWLNQETAKILPSEDAIFYTHGSLCESRAGASDTLDIMESYELGSLATVLPIRGICNFRLFWLLSEREHAQNDDLYMFDSKAVLLALSSCTISSQLLH